MYFSKHNEKTVYINHYRLLEVEGEGELCREDAEAWPTMDDDWRNQYTILSVKEGITGLGDGYLESFPNISCLILSRTVEAVATTPKHDKRMRKNKVLIRGEYGTFAEKFACDKGLKFLHCDIPLAVDDLEEHHEHDIITLHYSAFS